MFSISKISSIEILDSRGKPTLKTTISLESGVIASASVPSGASTGAAEAMELRDHDLSRYRGNGCLQACANVNTLINSQLSGNTFAHQEHVDRTLIELDGTTNKSRLGANAILSVSLAFARAASEQMKQPLFEYFAELTGHPGPSMPNLSVNLFSGGAHAGGQVAIQDCLIVPHADSIRKSLEVCYDTYQQAIDLTAEKFQMRALTADEGGLSPDFTSSEEMLATANEVINLVNKKRSERISMALDVAASQFYSAEGYHIHGETLSHKQFIEVLQTWVERFPIISLEDGLAEDAWDFWPQLFIKLQGKSIVLGDDFLCSNPSRIARAIESKSANALLLKVNQIGSLTEALDALSVARSAGWAVVVSARSGETEDDWLADLAVGWSADYIKVGSITQSERLAKYNRLLEIEQHYGLQMAALPTLT